MAFILDQEQARNLFDRIPQESRQQQSLHVPEFTPTCQQVRDWWTSEKKLKFLFGATQSGKSTTGGAYVAEYMRTHPNSLTWAVGTTFEKTRICYRKLKGYLADEEIQYIVWASRNKGIAHSIKHKNGSEVFFKSQDSGFMQFEGDQVDLIWPDEEIKDKMVFTSCLARTTMTNGQIIGTMTPLNGKTWLYYEYIYKPHPDVFHTTITLYDNFFLPKEQRDQMIRLYSPREIPYRIYGKWGVVEGRIYEEFAEETHVIPFDFEKIRQCPTIIRTLDFGRTLACLWIGINHYERIYAFAEIQISEISLQDFSELIFEKEDEIGLEQKQDIITYSDHAFQERFELERYGIDCIPAEKAVELGIEVVRRRLKIQTNGEPGVYVMDSCPILIDQLNDYQYDKTSIGKELTGKPRKLNDHLVDNFRYGLVAADDYCEYRYDQYLETAVESDLSKKA